MKCPHCKYEDDWSSKLLDIVNGDKGSFYTHPVKLEREGNWNEETKHMFGCPSCGATFIEV